MMEVLTSSHPLKTIDSNYFGVSSTRYNTTVYQTASLGQTQYRPRNPPTPPQDNSIKMSLPPISSLLRLSRDEGRTTDFTAHQYPHYPPYRDVPHSSGAGQRDDGRSDSNASNVSQHLKLPPTPPMHSYVTNSHPHSPSRGQRTQPPPLTTNGVLQYDPVSNTHNYRQIVHSQHGSERQFTNQTSYSPHTGTAPPSATLSSPMTGPNSATTPHSTSYHRSPLSTSHRTSYTQRPLPTDFPPPVHLPTPTSHLSPSVTSPTIRQNTRREPPKRQSTQHERARTPDLAGGAPNQQLSSSQTPQSQDRYVCPTCGKAFSRPSSLRIHGHSHTGEKPFKCPHKNCGKAFSVRSNMKRHEKGCHAERERRLDIGPGGASRELLPAVAS